MTGIDLNRAGTPLIEIVSEPDMRSAAEALAFARKMHGIVTSLGICDGAMAQGSMRFDVNISVRPMGSDVLGHPHRNQEPQFFQIYGRRDSLRGPAPDRVARRWWHR